MSDQYTRVTTGGSPLAKDAPVVGLLLGTRDDGALQIMDADDIPIVETADGRQQQQISLHQAVFPQHSVVGWYRVSTDVEPTANDLQMTKQLQQAMGATLVFCFLQVKQHDKDSLPITLFEMRSNILVALEGWKLETSEAEKLAVEKVVREHPQKSKSAFATHATSLQQALERMKERLIVLIQFLEDTATGLIPRNPALLRQVQTIVYQLGPLVATTPDSDKTASSEWISQLAVSARTVQVVQGYTEKFRLVQENKLSSSRENRRYLK